MDRRYLQDRLGVLLRSRGPSNQAYKEFNNLALDCVMEGTSKHKLTQLVCKLFDVPCTECKERIQKEYVTGYAKYLVTDRAVYKAPIAAKFLYSVGESVLPGTILSDGIVPLTTNSFPGPPILLERRFLGSQYKAGLIFPNEECRLSLSQTQPFPVFPVIGRPEDVHLFWSMFWSNVYTCRHLVDGLAQIAPGGRLNPAQFLLSLLYPRALFYTVYLDRCGTGRLPMVNSKLFRELVPPGVLFSLMLASPVKQLEAVAPKFDCGDLGWYSVLPQVSHSLRLTATDISLRSC